MRHSPINSINLAISRHETGKPRPAGGAGVRFTSALTSALGLLCATAALSGVPVELAQAADQAPSGGLEEIVVTAQKREQKLQDVPIAVTAVTAATIESAGLQNNKDLNLVVPGLIIYDSGTYTLPTIRGVSTTLTSLGDEPNIATYIDGVYLPASFALFYRLADVERIEVLKGPQGTLFGRNSTGGAISITTKEPSFDPEGDISLGYGRFNEVDVNAYAAMGFTDTIAGSIAAFFTRSDGYIHDINLNQTLGSDQTYSFRTKLLMEPSDDSKVTVSFDYERDGNSLGGPVHLLQGNALTKIIAVLSNLPPPLVASEQYTSSENRVPKLVTQGFGLGIDGEVDFGDVKLVSVTGARTEHTHDYLDLDATSFDFANLAYGPKDVSASEDLRLQSNGDSRLTWTAGLNGFADKQTYDPFVVEIVPVGTPQFATVTTVAIAAYGQAEEEILDNLTLVLGGRYGIEHKDEKFLSAAHPQFSTGETAYDFSPKATLKYQFAPATQVYATYSKGFKSGAYNPGSFQKVPVAPEKLYAYELGLKTDVTSYFRANLSAFYYDYKNIQVQSFNGTVTNPAIENAAAATMYGIDGDLTASFSNTFADADRLRLTTGFAYLYSTYNSYPHATTEVPNIIPGLGGIGNSTVAVDATGNRLVEAPRWTVNVGVNYTQSLGIGDVTFDAQTYYNSGFFYDAANSPILRQASYVEVNLSLGWNSPDKRYSASLWGRNVTDAIRIGEPLANAFGDPAISEAPATYGATFGYHF